LQKQYDFVTEEAKKLNIVNENLIIIRNEILRMISYLSSEEI